VYVERGLPPVPRGYRRGIIDGHVVVHNASGFILDVAVLFNQRSASCSRPRLRP
jgi:hypothetical protein